MKNQDERDIYESGAGAMMSPAAHMMLSQVNTQQRLNNAKKQIQIIQYKCSSTVATENEKILNIRVPGQTEGAARGPISYIDILENCEAVLKFEVIGKKAPLKVNFHYDKTLPQPDLKIYSSDEHKLPNAQNSM